MKLITFLLLITLVSQAITVFCITNGVNDTDTMYPQVARHSLFGGVGCSAILIHPRVLLGAGHCLFVNELAFLNITGLPQNMAASFEFYVPNDDPSIEPGSPDSSFTLLGTGISHPYFVPKVNFNGLLAPKASMTFGEWQGFTMLDDLTDTGVFILDEPVEGVTPADLVDVGALGEEELRNTLITSVGYGVTQVVQGLPDESTEGVRRYTTGQFQTLVPAYLYVKANAAQGYGGTCAGDSGGPQFLGTPGNSTTIVSTTWSSGHVCQSLNQNVRLDRTVIRCFIDAVLATVDNEETVESCVPYYLGGALEFCPLHQQVTACVNSA